MMTTHAGSIRKVQLIKGLVIFMSILIFLGLIALVWTIFNLNEPSNNINNSTLPEKISLGIPKHCEISEIKLNTKFLTVRTYSSNKLIECDQIYIINLSKGRVVSTVGR